MSMYVLSMILFGGFLGGSLIGGCGEDAAPGGGNGSPLPSEGEGQGEGEGEGSQNEGEGDTGEGEGEGPLPPGGDLEPCGGVGKNECRDGYECLTCEEAGVENLAFEKPCVDRVCTCPQWFEGRWWAEFTEVRRTDGQEYDFMAPGLDRQFWEDQEVTFEQDGCTFQGPNRQFLWGGHSAGSRGEVNPPNTFFYERMWDAGDNMEHPLRSSGQISEDGKSVRGTCTGEYPNWSDLTLFNITCTFKLTQRE